MDITISSLEKKEFEDLLTISAVHTDTKTIIMSQLQADKIASDTFFELLNILREEDRLDREMQQNVAELADFDPEAYTRYLQRMIESEIEKYLAEKAA